MKRNSKLIILVGLVIVIIGAVVFLGNSGAIQAETKNKAQSIIGYVDVMEVFEFHPDTKTAKKELDNKALDLQKELEGKLTEDMEQEERKKIIEEYQAKLTQREQELTGQVIASIDETIREVADELGIKVVMDKNNVIYGGQDLTEEVKNRITQKFDKNEE